VSGGAGADLPRWAERYPGGSLEREAAAVERFVEQIHEIQRRNRTPATQPVRRAFHAKLLAGVADARLEIAKDVPPDLVCPLLQPGVTHPAIVRLSSASGMVRPDQEGDLRGIAVRVTLPEGAVQDLLMTNAAASHARDARQFMVTGLATSGGRRLGAIPILVWRLGPFEAVRILKALRRATSRPTQSLAMETFWSRGPFAIGTEAVKLILRPPDGTTTASSATVPRTRSADLRSEFASRLGREDVRYLLQVQRFVDERRTPIEDGTVEWTEAATPPITVATLVLPRQDLGSSSGAQRDAEIDAVAFTPWNDGGGLRPIGGLNRARRLVYRSSARARGAEG
jgi:hypothetical protein